MPEEIYFLATEQYKHEAYKWLLSVRRGESVSVLFVSKTDRFVRLGQLLNDQKILKKAFENPSKYILQRVDFDAHDVEEYGDLQSLIAAQVNSAQSYITPFTFNQIIERLKKRAQVLVLIIAEAEKFLVPEGKQVLTHLSQLVEEYGDYLRIISFFEKDITHPSLLSMLPASSQLYENVYYYPLYSKEHTLNFIDLVQHYWHMETRIEPEEMEDIYHGCGGHFWLVKEAVRSVLNYGKWDSDQEAILFRLRTIYNLLLPSEQNVLEKISMHKQILSLEEQLSLKYLRRMEIVTENKDFKVALIKEYIIDHRGFSGELVIQDNDIYLNHVPINRMLSREEQRVIKFLVTKKNTLVSRDEIAGQIWPTNTVNKYSDWAIDQLVTRVRRRLQELSIPPRLLQVVRGKGYIFKI